MKYDFNGSFVSVADIPGGTMVTIITDAPVTIRIAPFDDPQANPAAFVPAGTTQIVAPYPGGLSHVEVLSAQSQATGTLTF
jgi:hypothetical protein